MAATGARRLVIKVGGAEIPRIPALLQELRSLGGGVVLVHGGGAEITRRLAELGIESRFIDGRRVTTPEAATVAHAALLALQADIRRLAAAAGLEPESAQHLFSLDQTTDLRLGAVGEVADVDVQGFLGMVEKGQLPVCSSANVGRGGQHLNVNADDLASAIAGALGAELVLFTDVSAVRGPEGDIPRLSRAEALDLIAKGDATGGMHAKLDAGLQSLSLGAKSVWIGRMADERPIEGTSRGGTRLVI